MVHKGDTICLKGLKLMFNAGVKAKNPHSVRLHLSDGRAGSRVEDLAEDLAAVVVAIINRSGCGWRGKPQPN